MVTDSSIRRIHLWSGLIVLSVFLAGAVAGAGVFAWLRPNPPSPPLPPGRLRAHLSELGLTAEQQEQANAILEKHRIAVEATLKETFPRVRAAQEQMEHEVRAVLTAAQAKKLDEIESRPRPAGGPRHHGPPGSFPPPVGFRGDRLPADVPPPSQGPAP